MAKVICEAPNASALINGVTFSPFAEGGMLSEDVDDDTAEAFCAIPGYRLALDAAPRKEKAGAGTAGGADIAGAIGKLDPDNKDHWTADGKPDANALSDLLDRRVSAAERDAAWAAMQPDAG